MLRFTWYLATSDIIIIDDYYPEIYKVDYPPNVKDPSGMACLRSV